MEDEVLVCSLSDMAGLKKKRLTVNNRDIVVVKAKEKFYAMDSFCYHAGGPLYNGDIEDEVLVCSLSDMAGLKKKRLTVNNRDIVVVKAKEKFYAMDSFCYHAGGPLYNGDIEELGGRMCLVCPWHKYKVCIDTGQNFYQSVDPHNLDIPPRWTAGDVRQRTHKVTVRDGNIYVVLSEMDGTLDSDQQNKRSSQSNS